MAMFHLEITLKPNYLSTPAKNTDPVGCTAKPVTLGEYAARTCE